MEEHKKMTETNIPQRKAGEMQSEFDDIETKIENNEKLPEDDIKYIGELGWLAALSVTIAAIATNI